MNFEVTKVRKDQNNIESRQEYYSNAHMDEHTEQGVYHGNGGEEDLEVELNDGVYTEERIASPGPRDRFDATQDISLLN